MKGLSIYRSKSKKHATMGMTAQTRILKSSSGDGVAALPGGTGWGGGGGTHHIKVRRDLQRKGSAYFQSLSETKEM